MTVRFQIGSSSKATAVWTTRSLTVGMPSGRVLPSPLGMRTRRTGLARYVLARSSSCNVSRHCVHASSLAGVNRAFLPVHARRASVARHGAHRCFQHIPPQQFSVEAVEPVARFSLGFAVEHALQLLDFRGVVIRSKSVSASARPSAGPSPCPRALTQVPRLRSPPVLLSGRSSLLRGTPTTPATRARLGGLATLPGGLRR